MLYCVCFKVSLAKVAGVLASTTGDISRLKMSAFAVLLEEAPDESLKNKIEQAYPRPHHYKVNECSYLVRAEGITGDVASELGMNKEGGVVGIVLKLNSARAGWYDPTIWEWFQLEEDESK